jgi:hypothetical protein
LNISVVELVGVNIFKIRVVDLTRLGLNH